ncbi:Polyol transporter [Thalictrum thalictroides]|uniref:Polyol transporter n=1 Tax=Thalictrum thalictroides TaxID=46969 RepID=A0A7J6VP86_THATH|nr:Polyol transporter [Thalictrum thalictroides]
MSHLKSDRNVEAKVVQSPADLHLNESKNKRFAFACSILGSMTSIMLGYDIGVMAGASIFIQRDLKINDVQLEILVGTINLYSLFGSALAGKTSDLIGRKYTIVLAATIFFVGAILMGFAINYGLLMFGRFVAGIGVGYALMIAPVYTSELAPTAARGFLTSFPEIFINFGVLLGFLSNWGFSKLSLKLGWRVMLGIGAIPSFLLGILVLIMPESPRWLVMKGRLGDAKRILLKTSTSTQEAESRLLAIQEAAGIPLDCTDDVVNVPKVEKGHEVWKELLLHPTPTVRRILLAAIGIHFFQQASGIDAVVLYSPRIFKKAGIVSESALLGATVAVGFVKTFAILISTFLLDKVGRRPLLLSSVGGMIVSVTLLAVGLTVVYQNPDKKLMWAISLSIAMVLFYVGFFSMGLGPIAWVYSSEIYPLRLRAQGTSLGVAVNRLMSGIIGTTFLSMTKALTTGGSFFLFAGICVIAWLFFYKFLPETRGRNLEDMDALFGKKAQHRDEINNGHVELGTSSSQV